MKEDVPLIKPATICERKRIQTKRIVDYHCLLKIKKTNGT
jgi:hypothetical protein